MNDKEFLDLNSLKDQIKKEILKDENFKKEIQKIILEKIKEVL